MDRIPLRDNGVQWAFDLAGFADERCPLQSRLRHLDVRGVDQHAVDADRARPFFSPSRYAATARSASAISSSVGA
jgi:hypothetical protein